MRPQASWDRWLHIWNSADFAVASSVYDQPSQSLSRLLPFSDACQCPLVCISSSGLLGSLLIQACSGEDLPSGRTLETHTLELYEYVLHALHVLGCCCLIFPTQINGFWGQWVYCFNSTRPHPVPSLDCSHALSTNRCYSGGMSDFLSCWTSVSCHCLPKYAVCHCKEISKPR